MDLKTRELERKLSLDSGNFALRCKLTSNQLRQCQGRFLVWRNLISKEPGLAGVHVKLTYDAGIPVEEVAYVLVILDMADMLAMMRYAPDAVLELPSKRVTSLNGSCVFQVHDVIEEKPREDLLQVIRKRANRQGTVLNGMYHFYQQPIYDRQVIEPGSYTKGVIPFFINALGETADFSKTYYTRDSDIVLREYQKFLGDTNMDQGGSLPYPKQFTITGYSIITDFASDLEEYKQFVDAAWFRFFIGTMDRTLMPLRLVAGVPQGEENSPSIEISAPLGPHFVLKQPHDLIPQQNFRAEIILQEPVTLTKPLNLRCILWGYFIREVY